MELIRGGSEDENCSFKLLKKHLTAILFTHLN